MESFHDLALPAEILRILDALNFTRPTPIQTLSIPPAMTGKDLIACAQTGSGKTLAFSLPFVSKYAHGDPGVALILTPTRELALQISQVLKEFTTRLSNLHGALIIGGESMKGQIKTLATKPRIIVATPGRLVDHLQQGTISLSKVNYLVLDEADRMLDMGFAPQLNMILEHLPNERQTLLFSATFPPDIARMATKYMHSPERVNAAPRTDVVSPQIEQKVVRTDNPGKNEAVLAEIRAREGSIIVFTRTKIRTERLARNLHKAGFTVTLLHGDRSQGQRRHAIEGFRHGKYRILVATDVAARGLDIPHVAHVINFDLPSVAEDYVHRIGRTGRAGATGQAVSFVTEEDGLIWKQITRLMTGKTPDAPAHDRPQHGQNAQRSKAQRPGGRRFGKGKPRSATGNRHSGHSSGAHSGHSNSSSGSRHSHGKGGKRFDRSTKK